MHRPFAIISDQHYHNWSAFSHIKSTGINSRLSDQLAETRRCAEILRSRGGNTIYCAGDMFHVRGSIEPSVFNPVHDCYHKLGEDGFEVRAIPGNHDLASNSATQLGNAMQSLDDDSMDVSVDPVIYTDHRVAMIPWMPMLEDVKELLKRFGDSGDIRYAIIHAPLNNVIMGIPNLGLEPAELASYGIEKIFCGHYHNHVSFNDQVYSIGAMTHQTWSDVDTKAGFIIVDDGEVEYIPTIASEFVDYDSNWTDAEASERCNGNYVRVELGEVTETELTDIRKFITQDLEAAGCIIKSVPSSAVVTRTASIKSGASLARSVGEWSALHADSLGVGEKELQEGAQEVLDAITTEEIT